MTADLEERIAYARRWTAGAPYYARMGITLQALEEGRAMLRLDVTPNHLNGDGPVRGIVHGGVLPALADAAMGCPARTIHGDGAQLLTAESNLRYLGAVSDGSVFAEGRMLKAGRRIVFTEVEIRDGAERILAKGGGTFVMHTPR